MAYSRTSLSRTRLFRITAYLEVKIWSLFLHETMTTGYKIMWKRGEIAPKEQFLLFSTLFYIYISNFRSQITYPFVKYVVQFIVFLTLSTLICRGTDISKCFSESLGIRDNESLLYIVSNIQRFYCSLEYTYGFPEEGNAHMHFFLTFFHYENTPMQIYRKFHLQKLKIFR